MPGDAREMITAAERLFPVRIRIGVPRAGSASDTLTPTRAYLCRTLLLASVWVLVAVQSHRERSRQLRMDVSGCHYDPLSQRPR
jgi:hypothetical protein